jgi:hypothetical protein
MALKNYTSMIAPAKTLMEIQAMLGKARAKSISIDYDNDGQPAAVSFVLMLDDFPQTFRLPRNDKGALVALKAARIENRYKTIDHAKRVSWRILKDWLDAQLALVECNQAEMAQAFMPYATQGDTTLFEAYRASRQLQLGAGNALERRTTPEPYLQGLLGHEEACRAEVLGKWKEERSAKGSRYRQATVYEGAAMAMGAGLDRTRRNPLPLL